MLLAIRGRISRAPFRNVGDPKLAEMPEARAKSAQLSFIYRKHSNQRLFKFPILHRGRPEPDGQIPSFVFESQPWCLSGQFPVPALFFWPGVLFSRCSRPVNFEGSFFRETRINKGLAGPCGYIFWAIFVSALYFALMAVTGAFSRIEPSLGCAHAKD